MAEFTAAQRKDLRRLVELAYERELNEELGALEESFHQWRCGSINAYDLSQAIHEFHDGPARDLYVRYNRLKPDVLVAHAFARGVLTERAVYSPRRTSLRRFAMRSNHKLRTTWPKVESGCR
jgi:hypothetical protein